MARRGTGFTYVQAEGSQGVSVVTARKVAAKKATPKKDPQESIPARVEAFEGFGARARASGLTFTNQEALKRPPYILGKDKGFDPPITISFPDTLTGQVMLDQAVRREDTFGIFGVLTGNNLIRITRTFDAYVKARGEGDAMLLLAGLSYEALDHFIGPGAADVEGGTPAS